jgi:hypothetical protein
MIATYPLSNAFLRISNKTADSRKSHSNAKDADAIGLDPDQTHPTAFGSPDAEDDNYHLGKLIYML